ncbi:MAG: PP2C family protein-serine/threonine phosphatase [Terracidiphilus sp.]
MRRIVLGIAALAVCGVMQLVAQHPHPPSPLDQVLRPHGHARPATANAPHTPPIVFDATGLGSPILLDNGWRVGITSNPAAAEPAFDDSAWAVRDARESIADVPDEDHIAGAPGLDDEGGPHGQSASPAEHQRPFAWFRLHLKLAPNHGPISLLIELPYTQNRSIDPSSHALGLDAFVNGKQIQPEGPHPNDSERYEQISRIYNLNVPPSETSMILAVRTVYVPLGLTAYTNFFADRRFRLGHPDDLSRELELWSVHSLFERLPRLIDALLLVVLSLFLLALYVTQKGHIEYLWLALYEVLQAPIAFVELAGTSGRLDTIWYGAVMLQLLVASAYLYFEFLVAFLSLRRRWYVRIPRYTGIILAGICPAFLFAAQSRSMLIVLILVVVGSVIWLGGWLVFVLITLISATVKRNFEAGLLLIPLVLTGVGLAELMLTGGLISSGSGQYKSPLTIQVGLIPVHFATFADFTGLFVIVLIIFVRFLRIQHDQERASSELAAARSVQELMIPQEKLETPGFEVDSVYNPANEVGGDFYHVQTTPDGGLLIVIGDVAGKGLKAAMNVSMLMGALRRTPERSPARILDSLNRVLVGSDSFTTCQAAWLGANGELVLANAGHLPPYLNSQEVQLPGGLPLGVLTDVRYEEVHLYLHPGDRILFLSDGVVEARKPSGELFGFDRVHNLSNQSAFYIADAAKEFGQEDDITVLTVRRLAQAMAA